MPVPTTNVTFSSIQTEFGGSNPISISEYYRGGALVPAGTATSATDGTPISTSGLIRVGMFRGTSAAPTGMIPSSYGTIFHNTISPVNAFAALRFNSSGQAFELIGASPAVAAPNWYEPTTTGIGNSYWIRIRRVSGSATGYVGATVNTWLQMSSTREIGHLIDGPSDFITALYEIDFSTSSGGTPIVGVSDVEINVIKEF